jgi:hypothetical protein
MKNAVQSAYERADTSAKEKKQKTKESDEKK